MIMLDSSFRFFWHVLLVSSSYACYGDITHMLS